METKQYLRLLKIDQIIRNGAYPNNGTLRQDLGISERTALRDIDTLKEVYHAPIRYSKHHNGYYYQDNSFMLSDMKLTEGDLLAVLIGRQGLSAYRHTPFYADMEKAFHRLSSLLPEYVHMDGKTSTPISIELYDAMKISPKSVKMFQSILDACKLHKKIKVEYRDPLKKLQVEVVSPYKLTFMSGAWYLVAYHDAQRKMKTYLIRRLIRIRKVKDSFDPETMNRIAQQTTLRPPTSDLMMIKARFSQRIADMVAERLVGMEDKMTTNAKGDLVVELTTADVDSTYSWLLSFGPQAEVLEPVQLRLRFRKELVQMVSMY